MAPSAPDDLSVGHPRRRLQEIVGPEAHRYLMAWGLIGEPTARVMGNGGATNMNS
jgi:hypothetical protein